ncbi:MAG: ribbon-helix-helix domain-containing protein [Bacillota bacterium]
MKPHLVNRKQFASTLDNELLENLNALSKRTDIPKTKLLDKAVTLLLNQYNDK